MKPRQNIYLDEELNKHLDTLAAKPGSSKSAIIRDALTAYLARRGAKELQDTFSKRLDEIGKQLNTIERQQRILIESLALFIRFHLGMVPTLPEAEQATAHALGTKRYKAFISQVSRLLAQGKNTGAEILELLNEELTATAEVNSQAVN
ncbi:MAG TPA: CopG family transcriptional regulator [Terriglobales bacterium]|nr:CopG family transcriptional regulator [Terriglobales bacterium]